jgi:hypothetical protein
MHDLSAQSTLLDQSMSSAEELHQMGDQTQVFANSRSAHGFYGNNDQSVHDFFPDGNNNQSVHDFFPGGNNNQLGEGFSSYTMS